MDGNPTSWYTKNGTRGTGFAKQTVVSGINAVNNTYHATQYPGTLWYHDHAMHATKHNVAQGLAGMFLIRDKNIEK
jgi:FtsP/CotA-like multicopper oxidase with cupredoxin domain